MSAVRRRMAAHGQDRAAASAILFPYGQDGAAASANLFPFTVSAAKPSGHHTSTSPPPLHSPPMAPQAMQFPPRVESPDESLGFHDDETSLIAGDAHSQAPHGVLLPHLIGFFRLQRCCCAGVMACSTLPSAISRCLRHR